MSKLVAVRVPDELLAKVDARGSRTLVILAALQEFLYPKISQAAVQEIAADMVNFVADSKQNNPKIKFSPTGKGSTLSVEVNEHDVKNCRVYGCLMCKMAGEK